MLCVHVWCRVADVTLLVLVSISGGGSFSSA